MADSTRAAVGESGVYAVCVGRLEVGNWKLEVEIGRMGYLRYIEKCGKMVVIESGSPKRGGGGQPHSLGHLDWEKD